MNIKIGGDNPTKRSRILWIILFSVFSVFVYNNADYANYQTVFRYASAGIIDQHIADIGFMILCRFAAWAGMSFELFRGVYIFVAICLLVNGVDYFCDNRNITYILYFIFPFALDVAQMRQLMITAIVIYSLRFIIDNKTIKFIVLILLASSQHVVAIAYLLLLLTKVKNEKISRYIIIATIAEFAVLLVLGSQLLNAVVGRISHFAVYQLFNDKSIRLCTLYMIMAFAIFVYCRFCVPLDSENEKEKLLDSVVLCSLLFVPMIMINDNFARLYRTLVVLIYCRLLIKHEKLKLPVRNLVAFAFCCFLFYIHLSPHNQNHWEKVFLPMFQNNYFFDLFR